jgi:hypothetical protein
MYAGDCLDVKAAGVIPADAAIVSDVPYGMKWDVDTTRFSGGSPESMARRGAGTDQRLVVAGDDRPFDPAPWLDYPIALFFGSNHFAARLPVGTTLVWIKRNDAAFGSFLSDAEIAWMKGGHGVYCYREFFTTPDRVHPTEKPVNLMRWCVERAKVPPGGLVVDPYMGSGTTGVAALETGRRFIGIEREPAYLEIAARRLTQAESDGEQISLFGAQP